MGGGALDLRHANPEHIPSRHESVTRGGYPEAGLAALLALSAGLSVTFPAGATLQDEIQVYDDSMNRPGQSGLELHVNATPAGVSRQEYPGEVVNVHGIRTTPEFSYGLTPTLEAGVYLPVVHAADGTTQAAGPRARLKWIPQAAPGQGWFYGLNGEVSAVQSQYEPSQNSIELRPIWGYRAAEWVLVTNPTLDYPLRAGYRQGGPEFDPSLKFGHQVREGIDLGFEYYADLGHYNQWLPLQQQGHVLFLALDVDRKPWVFNLGVGRGLTQGSDGWTLKGIFEIPLK